MTDGNLTGPGVVLGMPCEVRHGATVHFIEIRNNTNKICF